MHLTCISDEAGGCEGGAVMAADEHGGGDEVIWWCWCGDGSGGGRRRWRWWDATVGMVVAVRVSAVGMAEDGRSGAGKLLRREEFMIARIRNGKSNNLRMRSGSSSEALRFLGSDGSGGGRQRWRWWGCNGGDGCGGEGVGCWDGRSGAGKLLRREEVTSCVDIVWKLLVHQSGGSPAGIHGLFSGWYCGLASRKVTLGVSMAWAKGVTTGTLVRYETSYGRLLGDRVVDRLLDSHGRAGPTESGDSCKGRGSFGVIVGMGCLSKNKVVIVCHEKVVRISLEGDEILRVQVEFRIDLVPGATSGAKSPYRLAPLEMQELSEQHQELQDKVHLKLVLELLRKEKLYAKFTKSEAVNNWEVPTTPSEI
ncbi:hypothetical protein Tco_0099898 [Tanacetum coccineum]